jgi:hypothetical protein
MMNWLRHLLQLDAEAAIDLGPNEEILHVIGRHWVVLLARLIPPLFCVLAFGGLALYRAVGGTFLVSDSGAPIGLDLLNWILVAVNIGLMLAWLALYVRGKQTRRTRNIIVGVAAVILLLTWYRYNGGRVFFIDPVLYSDQQTDSLNTVLILLTVVSGIFMLFTFYDWLNDELILTNQRVVYDNDQVFIPRLLEQRVQEQIFLEDVQDVSAKTATYPQHLLNFGTVIVKSARIGGNIEFHAADGPLEMQAKIMGQVRGLRQRMSMDTLDTLIEERVYNNRAPKAKLSATIKQTHAMRLLKFIFIENPEFDENKGEYTWRPHWLFQLRALLGPLTLLLLGLFSIALLSGMFLQNPVWLGVLTALVILAFVAWTAWEIEDYRNDKYILSPTNVIDIEKKPFGPEDRRQAGLGAITNVQFKTTFISNLLGYGDVFLETAGAGGRFTFHHVPRPNEVVTVVNDYIVNFKRGEKAKALEDTVALLERYHAAQLRHDELNKAAP